MSKILSGLYQIWRISPCLVPVVYEMKSLVVSLVGGGGGKRAVVGEDLLLLLLLRGVCGAAAVGEGRVLLQDRDKGGSVGRKCLYNSVKVCRKHEWKDYKVFNGALWYDLNRFAKGSACLKYYKTIRGRLDVRFRFRFSVRFPFQFHANRLEIQFSVRHENRTDNFVASDFPSDSPTLLLGR
jgi:hypothetical protein